MAIQMDRIAAFLKGAILALALLLATGAEAAACRIAVLGDSLTAAYGLDVADGFPARLEQALREQGYDCAVLDAGVSGDTTAGGLARLDWMLADEPSHVIVELGANDGLRALPAEQMEQNLEGIITRLQDEGIPVLLTGMLAPPNLGRDYGAAFEAVFPRLARGARRAALPVLPRRRRGRGPAQPGRRRAPNGRRHRDHRRAHPADRHRLAGRDQLVATTFSYRVISHSSRPLIASRM